MILFEFAFALFMILLGAELFTNGVEWLGKKLNLSEGAVGSVLAAVGTAMPEATIPVIALLYGTNDSAVEIGTGAILGAPLMLSTIAMFVSGVAVYIFAKRRKCIKLNLNTSIMGRDLKFFVTVYSVALIAGIISNQTIKTGIAVFLVLIYFYYVYRTMRSGCSLSDSDIPPLIFAKKKRQPAIYVVITQVVIAIVIIIVGGHLFVDAIEKGALLLGISYFVLATLIIPIATELPEKFNSVIWIRQGKDTLAIGNITGAMVFQSSIIPAIGIMLSPWRLQGIALLTGILTLVAGLVLLINIMTKKELTPGILMFNGLIYVAFIITVLVY
jgi:cation:H+ antiporter